MNELNNIALSLGKYKNNSLSLSTNTVTTSLKEALTITKASDKLNWQEGTLTYTIIVTNNSNNTYKDLAIEELINTNLVGLMNKSVTINNIKTEGYTYINNTLLIPIEVILPHTKQIITFAIKKNTTRPFKLTSTSLLKYNQIKSIESNKVTVISQTSMPRTTNYDCGAPYWRI